MVINNIAVQKRMTFNVKTILMQIGNKFPQTHFPLTIIFFNGLICGV